MNCNIFTIGYGNRKIDEFISLLKKLDLRFLIDVRSFPYSKINIDYNKETLDLKLKEQKIRYVFMGDTLGGRPKAKNCYDSNGNVNYEILKKEDFFLEGLNRLLKANENRVKVVIMCSELKPQDCHRSKLIGEVLSSLNVPVLHICEKNELKEQKSISTHYNKGFDNSDIFGNNVFAKSRNSYGKE